MPRCLPPLAFALVLSFSALAHADWPQFRGPTGQGVVAAGDAPTRWDSEDSVIWKATIPGKGWSSPVVWADQVWLTTAIQTEAPAEETSRRTQGIAKAAKLDMQLAANLSLRAVCVDRTTGELLKDIELFSTDSADSIHALNSYASPTPVIEAGRLYCHFGTYGNACVDTATGEVLWRRVLPLKHYVGPGSSPVVHGDLMILTCDGADQQYVTALDKRTGETVWKTDRPPIRQKNPDFRKSYCTPIVVEDAGAAQVLVTGAQWFVAYDAATGEALWRVDHGPGFSVVPRPVNDGSAVYFSTGYASQEMQAVRLGGSGDVTDSHVLWRSRRQTPTQASPQLVGDRLYTVSDNGVGACLDTKTGKPLWQARLGGTYSASPLLSGELVYFFSREGKTTVVRNAASGPQIERTNEIGEAIMATPAVVGGVMYLRAAGSLYAIANGRT
ncbi:MAG: PQQ-binding-like beta-propeller repeat protein [Planctomycetota bacterium]